jgi:1-hydroxycarotenoid 3,4-desaturase
MADHKVVVVGAGMAGLVSALQLAHAGLQVTVIDKVNSPGGKIRQLMPDGMPVDSGPTVFTMRWVFDQIMASVGTRLESQLQIQPLDILARHFWEDGSQLDLYADPAQSLDAVARFAGPAEAQRFAQFCQTARQVYDALEGPFIKSPSPTMAQMMTQLGCHLLRLLAVGSTRHLDVDRTSGNGRRVDGQRRHACIGHLLDASGASTRRELCIQQRMRTHRIEPRASQRCALGQWRQFAR